MVRHGYHERKRERVHAHTPRHILRLHSNATSTRSHKTVLRMTEGIGNISVRKKGWLVVVVLVVCACCCFSVAAAAAYRCMYGVWGRVGMVDTWRATAHVIWQLLQNKKRGENMQMYEVRVCGGYLPSTLVRKISSTHMMAKWHSLCARIAESLHIINDLCAWVCYVRIRSVAHSHKCRTHRIHHLHLPNQPHLFIVPRVPRHDTFSFTSVVYSRSVVSRNEIDLFLAVSVPCEYNHCRRWWCFCISGTAAAGCS